MSQPSILSFFGKSSSKDKVEKKFNANVAEAANISAITNKTIENKVLIENEEELKPSKKQAKRSLLIDSDSENSIQESIKPTKKLKIDSETADYTISDPILYDPTKKPYDIVADACWRQNEKVPYLALANTFKAIEAISQRLEITRVLSNFLRSVIYLSIDDLVPSIYLCLNKVAPDYEGIELGIGDSVIIDSLVQATDTSKESVKALMKVEGDLGNVANILKSSQKYLSVPPKLTLPTVFNKLKEIAYMSGKTVQKKKVMIIKNMLISCRNCEKKYLVRGLTGKLRIGLAEQTVLAALGQAITLTPTDRECPRIVVDIESNKSLIDKTTAILKNAFCECPNYSLIIDSVIKHGVSELPRHCSISPGVPIKPMLAHPSKGVSEIFRRFDKVDFVCEYKYDGERAQIHVDRDSSGTPTVQVFSRNQENNTGKYPDIVTMVTNVVITNDIKSCILDSEAVAWDRVNKSILPFQVLSTRKRKDVDEKNVSIQVCIYAFDLLYFNGVSLVKKSYRERREILRKNFVETSGLFMMATSLDSTDTDEISEFLDRSINDKCEGLMIKTLDSDATYEISRRSHNWLKLKKDYLDGLGDSLDLVVIGASYGNGKRANKYGNFLLACYEPDSGTYQSICKLGTGLSDDRLDEVYSQLRETVVQKPRPIVVLDPSCKMDVWFEPSVVWEVKAADLSISPNNKAAIGLVDKDKGISLRFPRFLRARDDKKPENATTARQIAEMYLNQAQIKGEKNVFDDDEFY